MQAKFTMPFSTNIPLPDSIDEIDSKTTDSQFLRSVLPRLHPLRPQVVCGLSILRFYRYRLSNQEDDLDKTILHLTESILLQPRPPPEPRLTVGTFYFLAVALIMRSHEKQSENATYAAKYLRHVRDKLHAAFQPPRHEVTAWLIYALEWELRTSDKMQNIEEMAVLCQELLTSEASDDDTTPAISIFSGVVSSKISPFTPDHLSNQVIECLRLAKTHKPNLREALFALAYSLHCRYLKTSANDDYEEAASMMDEIINSSSPGDSQDEDLAKAHKYMRSLASSRAIMYQTPEYTEQALYRAHAYLHSSSAKESFGPEVIDNLENIAKKRFRDFGFVEGLEASPSRDPPLSPALSFEQYNFGPELAPFFSKVELLGALLSGIRKDNVDETIEKGRTILASFDPSHPFMPLPFVLFSLILDRAFKCTNNIEYLNESISTHRQLLGRPSVVITHHVIQAQLSVSLFRRFESFPDHRAQDLDEALELFSLLVNKEHFSLPDRFRHACLWAHVARRNRHPSTPTAYERAVSLMQDSLLFAPTLQLQHETLAKIPGSHSTPLDYASYQVDLHRPKEAIETLERGRALLWSELRHLRTSIELLLKADPDLGRKFAGVNRDLEELTKSNPPSHNLSIDDGPADDRWGVDPFGRLILKQRRLLKERDKLISLIQTLPGFDRFLTYPSFDTLRSAASSGPVIIINHTAWRSDILILLQDTSPSLIPTPDDFYDSASGLKDKLLDSRNKHGLDSSHYDQTLTFVLAELYELVGKPVIDRLRQLRIPEQSRIWWCPTSVFCSLPLHAMGPIPDDDKKRYFLDLYICSYTPSLSALIQSRHRDLGPRSSDRPSVLLVAQPDPFLPIVEGEIQVVQALDTEVTSLLSEAATPAAVIDGFQHHRFVHFACHGTLEAGKPFEAGFELHGGERLTLLEIVRSHLPAAEFAFLSACHTAEVTEGSAGDEALHLAAAVQFCGFRSVVGTTWAMADEDGRDLAEYFYKALFSTSKRDQGIPYHERSAKALRFAVKKLRRKKNITVERWVNFVHYGA